MIENMNEIESSLGLAEGTLQEAIASEDAKKIEIPTGTWTNTDTHEVFLKEDYAKRTDNLKEENKTAGIEIAVKGARTDLGLDFEGKTIDNLLAAYKSKILADAKIEPDGKISELESDKLKLQELNKEYVSKYDSLVAESLKKDGQRSIDENILSKLSDKLTLSKADAMLLFKARYEVVEEGGKIIVKQGGETMKDNTTLEPLSLETIIDSFTEPYTKKPEGGAGGGDTTDPGKSGTLEAFNKEMESRGDHALGSENYMTEMNVRISNGSLKV
jgi:hypothetical protein|tara:strand:+ start:2424 stop:3242 length:819 start_codon:yes stop_codon:yes gene_type:complete